jgi:hypothetical protein
MPPGGLQKRFEFAFIIQQFPGIAMSFSVETPRARFNVLNTAFPGHGAYLIP